MNTPPMLRSRRRFLLSAASVAGLGALGNFGVSLQSFAAASAVGSAVPTDYRALVCFFLFGGNDNGNTLIPYDQSGYNDYVLGREGSLSRPLGVTRLRSDLLPLVAPSLNDGRQVGLPKEMSRLKSLYDGGKLAIVPNVGVLSYPTTRSQYESRTIELPPQLFSHSDHQRFWQLGVPSYSTRTGWGGRMADLLAAANSASAVSMCVSLSGNNVWQVGDYALPYPVNAETGASEFWSFWDSRRRGAAMQLNQIARPNMLQRQASAVFNRTVAAQELMQTALQGSRDFSDLFGSVPGDLNPGLVEDYMHVQEQMHMVARMIDVRAQFGHRRQIYFIGLGGCGGGLGEKIAVKRRWVHKISSDIPLDQAALIEPLSVGYHAVDRSDAIAGDTVLITGAGPIGLLTAAVCKARGLTTIISEPSPLRRQKAADTGVGDHILDPTSQDVVAETFALTGGRGADAGFECTSVQPALDTLFDALKPTGVLVVVSIWGHPGTLDMQKLVLKEIDMRGTIAYVNSHPDTIKLVEEGKVDLAPFITGKIGLDHLIDEGFDTLIHRNETAVKILVSPSGAGL